MKKKFSKERFYKKLRARKLHAMKRIELGIKLAQDVMQIQQEFHQAHADGNFSRMATLSIQNINLNAQVELFMAYRL
jgi:hypothetical protein